LNTTLDDLNHHKVYLDPFLNSLWQLPDIMYKILIKSDPEDVKNNLAPFVVHNFYCNLLSGNYIENNLLYIIALTLKDEIDKLENINQVVKFLDDTICGYLLEQLQKMPDIQIFFKNVILKTVETIERTCSSKVINFSIKEKEKEFAKIEELGSRKGSKTVDISSDLMEPEQKQINPNQKNESQKDLKNLFMKYYIADLSAKDFDALAQKAKNEDKTNLANYFSKFVEEIKSKGEALYYNKIFIKEINDKKYSNQILKLYESDFLQIISFAEQIIKDLMKNILFLPNTIKFICKIISILIKNKFTNISKIEENAFISKFIFNRLLNPIVSFPSFNALISDFVISGNTIENIKVINFVLSKLFSGKLFENNQQDCCYYTPFNRFILDKMETILSFFEKAINVNLPKFIEQLANNELPEDYQYDYFKENEEQIYANISICFNLNNIECLIKGLQKNKEIFEKIDKKDLNMQKIKYCYERYSSKAVFDDFRKIDEALLIQNKEKLKKTDKSKKNKKVEIENFYIYNSNVIEEKYAELFSLNNKNGIFYIKAKKGDKTGELREEERNIIKVKNYLCSSLGDYRLLNKSDFNLDSTSDTRKLLNEIKSYMSLPNFILSNNTIPSTWYINSILDYLNKMPDDYKENDYKKLFDELTKNLNDSINKLNFEILILFRNKLKFIGKIYDYYENVKVLMDTININEKIKQIAEETFIPMDLTFKYEENSKKFELKKSGVNKKQFEDNIAIIHEHKKNRTKISLTFKTVEAFTRYFPNLTKYQILQGTSPIEIINELSINEKLNNYFGIIKKEMLKIPEIKEQENLYKGKIEDYIMNKIYNKIYPLEPDEIDGEIYKQTIKLSWVDPYTIIKKDYIYDNILPDILNEFEKINIMKSPYQKLKCIERINKHIANLIKFNEGLDKEVGAEDITPILNYAFIKAHPFKIYTDIQFIKLFLPQNGENDFSISNMELMYTIVRESNEKQFNISPEEFKKKCNEAVSDHYGNN